MGGANLLRRNYMFFPFTEGKSFVGRSNLCLELIQTNQVNQGEDMIAIKKKHSQAC